MSVKLGKKDYEHILNYYKKTIPKNRKELEKEAKQIMAEKLCRCIKMVDPKQEEKSIAICSKSIFNDKGYTRKSFTCKKRYVDFSLIKKSKKNNRQIKNKTFKRK